MTGALVGVVAITGLASGQTRAEADIGSRPLGFIAIESQSPLQQLRFGLQHYVPWVPPARQVKIYVEDNWKNFFMYEPGYYRIDAEVHDLSVRTCVGLGKGFMGSVKIPVRYVSGGILDGFIEWFHRAFHLSDGSRSRFPSDQFFFGINPTATPDGWRYAGSDQIGWHLGNAVLALNYAVAGSEARGFPTIISANLKLPTGTELGFFGQQLVDVGMSATVGRELGSVWFYVSPGLVYYSQSEMLGIAVRQWHFSGLTALEYHPRFSRHSWTVQWTIESGVAKTFSQFKNYTFELLFGYEYRLSDQTVLGLGLLENLFYFDNSPDLAFHLGVTSTL